MRSRARLALSKHMRSHLVSDERRTVLPYCRGDLIRWETRRIAKYRLYFFEKGLRMCKSAELLLLNHNEKKGLRSCQLHRVPVSLSRTGRVSRSARLSCTSIYEHTSSLRVSSVTSPDRRWYIVCGLYSTSIFYLQPTD